MSLTTAGPTVIARKLYRNDVRHTPVASPDRLTDAHRAAYWDQGFIAVENVFTAAEVDAAKAGLSFLVGGGKPGFDGVQFEEGVDVSRLSADDREPYVRKLMYFVDHDARLAAMSAAPALVRIVEWLLGDRANMIQDMALLKPPHVGREKPWHQDDAYFMFEPLDGIVGTWTALDEATPENGCMHVIPASHRGGPKPHYHDRDCQLADEDVDVACDVLCPLKPGGVLLFHGLLHHGTPPNTSPHRRRALQFHYASAACRRTTPDEHAQFFRDARGMAACNGMTPRNIADKF